MIDTEGHMLVALLFIEFLLLFFISQAVTKAIFSFFWRVTTNQHVAMSAVTLLLFPGTVIHELAHLFTAEIMGVRTGKLTLVPEALGAQDTGVRAGSVAIAQTGPFRRALIGIAPVFVGLGSLGLLAYFIPGLLAENKIYWLILVGYLMFAISNSLFSSAEDLKGFWPIAIIVSLGLIAAWIAGIRIELTGYILSTSITVLTALTKSIALVLALNILLLLMMNMGIVLLGYSRLRTSKKAD